jgi:hypothetical protein
MLLRFVTLALALPLTSPAFAQAPQDWRAALHDLYRIEAAFDACKSLAPSAGDRLRLESAVAYVEDKTGLDEDELDELYEAVEREAEDATAFCKTMEDAVARVQKIPPGFR